MRNKTLGENTLLDLVEGTREGRLYKRNLGCAKCLGGPFGNLETHDFYLLARCSGTDPRYLRLLSCRLSTLCASVLLFQTQTTGIGFRKRTLSV
ncbi:hypothetical protein J6590_090864 [Homalodisca vitripennis]|nr:hypothetical protein J6590_090864 [Homalodisca vitripennis]